MNILFNGEQLETASKNLQDLLTEQGYNDMMIATAVNGEFVPKDRRGDTALNDADAIDVVAPMAGG